MMNRARTRGALFLASLATAACLRAQEPLAQQDDWLFDGGTWEFEEGTLRQTDPDVVPHAFYTASAFSDCTVSVDFRAHEDGDGVKAAGLILRSADSVSGYHVHYDTKNDQIILARREFGIGRTELKRVRPVALAENTWYTASTSIQGSRISVRLDGDVLMEVDDPAPIPAGIAGLYTSQGRIDFRNVSVEGTPATLDTPWRTRMSYEVPSDQGIADVLWVKPICVQPDRYIGWPTVCRRENGELLAIFSGDRSQHVCPWGKVQMVRSQDDGETWSDVETVCNTPLDDRDAGVIETRQGTLVVNWFTSLAFEKASYGGWLQRLESPEILTEWQRHAEKLTPAIRERWLGNWTRRSEDGGVTWEDPVQHLGSAPHGGIELDDGRLLFVGRGSGDGGIEMTVEESTDDGRSWQRIGAVPPNPDDDPKQYYEPHVVEAADGRLIAMFRYHYYDGSGGRRNEAKCMLRQSESSDGGKTWTPCSVTPMQGYPPHLIRLQDDTLLCVYGRRRPPYGEYACISRDGGRTWDIDNEIRLAAATSGDLGYPSSTQLADGSIITVFYQKPKEGEKTALLATKWRLK